MAAALLSRTKPDLKSSVPRAELYRLLAFAKRLLGEQFNVLLASRRAPACRFGVRFVVDSGAIILEATALSNRKDEPSADIWGGLMDLVTHACALCLFRA